MVHGSDGDGGGARCGGDNGGGDRDGGDRGCGAYGCDGGVASDRRVHGVAGDVPPSPTGALRQGAPTPQRFGLSRCRCRCCCPACSRPCFLPPRWSSSPLSCYQVSQCRRSGHRLGYSLGEGGEDNNGSFALGRARSRAGVALWRNCLSQLGVTQANLSQVESQPLTQEPLSVNFVAFGVWAAQKRTNTLHLLLVKCERNNVAGGTPT